jgi:iron-sulfur cluster repair protein YtfE (RIC family)
MSNEPLADVRDMYMVHALFRREYRLAPALIRGVADGDAERAAIVADHLQVVGITLYHHHKGEDTVVWPLLLERAGAQVQPLVRLMEEQHEAMEKLLAELRDGLAQWSATAGYAQTRELAGIAARLTEVLVEHLGMEEDRVCPLIEQYITAAEWGRMADGANDLPPERMPLMFGMLAYEGDPDLVAQIIAALPPEVGSVIGDLSAHAFAEHAQRLYGTATPERIGASR